MIQSKQFLTEEQTIAARRLYELDLPLDEVSEGYVRVILAMLDTIDDLRAALRIERGIR